LTADDKNVDTLFAPSPALNSLNLMISLGYKVSEKFDVGFNIDAIGISFGPTGSPSYIRNGKSTPSSASPTSTNILLVGDNDKGSLNSHLFIRYKLSDHLGLKVAYQFLFNELTTTTKIQTIPSANDRFRAKSGMVYVGLNYNF
jgi:long-subunit fatty acid transport protein